MQGEIVSPGGDDARGAHGRTAGEHAFKGDAQRVHQVRFLGVQDLKIRRVMFHQHPGAEQLSDALGERADVSDQTGAESVFDRAGLRPTMRSKSQR